MFVIVYGTLKKRGRLHGYMEGAKYMEDVEVEGYRMYDTGFGYPMVCESAGHSFYGELYKVDDTILETLDMVEGVRSGLFIRKMVSWADVISDCLGEDAMLYVIGDGSSISSATSTPIETGVWEIEKPVSLSDDELEKAIEIEDGHRFRDYNKILKNIKSKVTQIYAYTEGVNRDLDKSDLIDQLKHVSLSVEEISTYISDTISKMEK